MRTGVVGLGLALPGLALTGGYLSSRADKPLVGTGNLQAMAPRRLNETAQWLIDVTSPAAWIDSRLDSRESHACASCMRWCAPR